MTREYRRGGDYETAYTRQHALASDFGAEKARSETPAEKASAAVDSAASRVSELEAAIASVDAAAQANKPSEWDQATERVQGARARAEKQLAIAETLASQDAETAPRLATVRERFEAAHQREPAARPDGIARLSVEADLEALRAKAYPAPDGTTLRDWSATVNAEIAAQPIYATGRVIELHNETGFTPKPLNVAKAILYSLMPRGSIVKVPDSLWQSYLYASLMAGSAMWKWLPSACSGVGSCQSEPL